MQAMAQLTIRASEELIERVRAAARETGRSMNAYVADVLDAATDPDLAGDAAARLRAAWPRPVCSPRPRAREQPVPAGRR